MKRKIVTIVAIALTLVLGLTLFGCTKPADLLEKMRAEDANYTMVMTQKMGNDETVMTMYNTEGMSYTETKEGETTTYSGIFKKDDKFYEFTAQSIDGKIKLLSKDESEKVAKMEEMLSTVPTKELFETCYVEAEDGTYSVNKDKIPELVDKMLEILKIDAKTQVGAMMAATLKASFETMVMSFGKNEFTITMTPMEGVSAIMHAFDFGSTKIIDFASMEVEAAA